MNTLVIRAEQLRVFEEAAVASFEDRVLAHFERFFRERCLGLGDAASRRVIRHGVRRAAGHGFTTARSACTYIFLMFYLGSGFDEDPKLPWAVEILGEHERSPYGRIQRLKEATLAFLDRAEGIENEHLEAALARLRTTPLDAILPPRHGDLEAYLKARLHAIHPQKCEAIGDGDLDRFVRAGALASARHHLRADRCVGVLVFLMFMLGASVDDDPQFPWAKAALAGAPDEDQDAKAHRLYQAAMRYLNHGGA